MHMDWAGYGMFGFGLLGLLISLLPFALAALGVYYLGKIYGELKEIRGMLHRRNER